MDPLLERAIRGVDPLSRPFTPGLEAAIGVLSTWHEVAQTTHFSSSDEFGEIKQIFR
jgi:hypothetical protein